VNSQVERALMSRSGFPCGLIVAATVAACSAGLASPGVANAASLSFAVNTTADGHDAHPGHRICADSSGQCTLRAAIEETNAQPVGTSVTVKVPAGTYKLRLGTLAVTHNTITIAGAAATRTIVQQNGSTAVVAVSSGVHLTLVALELTGGGASSEGGGLYNSGTTKLVKVMVTGNTAHSGAGLTNTPDANLDLNSSIVSNNVVEQPADSQPGGAGGGIVNAGTLTLGGSTVTGNYAGEGGFGLNDTGGQGGNGGGIVNSGSLAANRSRITANYAGSGGPGENEVPGGGGSGGGIYSSAGTVTLTQTTVSGNFAGYSGAELTGDGPANAGNGGGISSSAKLIVTGSTISSNRGARGSGLGSEGGGLYNTGTATISTSTLSGNLAGTGSAAGSGYGGAIANLGTLTLARSTVSGNAAATGASGIPGLPGGNGGGLYQGGGTATLTADTLNGNSSGNGGPGIYCDGCFSFGGPGGIGGGIYSIATLSLTNTTLSGNTVGVGGANAPPLAGAGPPGTGGGLAVGGGNTSLRYATVADNSDGILNRGGSIGLGGTIVADSTGTHDQTAKNCTGEITEPIGFNLDSGTTCKLSLATDTTGKEPLLAALAANGGPAKTQALRSGSPAIDHGGRRASGCPPTDQPGLPRPDQAADNGSCDIGAYESQGLA
jgi:CSLREA domain-containing protein